MFKIIKKLSLLLIIAFLLLSTGTLARENVTYWYIKDFQSEIVVNKDSSLTITEKILADCGQAVGKHGIFRVLPTQVYKSEKQAIKMPIKLISISDFNDQPIKYSQSENRSDHTLTWKIGDPDVTVTGENYYKIKYTVENAIRFDNQNFDEFYWNLNGNFWDVETDSFTAKIIFPEEINRADSEIYLYSGSFGEKDVGLAEYQWFDEHTLQIASTRTFQEEEGITVSITLPKNIFIPYQPSFWEKYSQYFYCLLPLLVLIISYLLWSKFGRDPKINPAIVPEFAVPNKMSPMPMGMILSDGVLKNQYISAEIISLAVKGVIKIEKIKKKGIFGGEDYKLHLLKKEVKDLTESEKMLLNNLFDSKKEITLSSLRNKFYVHIDSLKERISDRLSEKGLVWKGSRWAQVIFIILAGFAFLGSFFLFPLSIHLAIAMIISTLILFVFSFFMPRRTLQGAEFNRKIMGFKLYMETAEKYRQRFHEKGNIFERFLPYAIMFGITGLWIAKMKQIYGEDYFERYHPVWFYGAGFESFNAQALDSAISSVSSNMASTLASSPSSSGAGGGGFSGGGGGGGGGGGW